VVTQDDAPVRNTVGMSATPAPTVPTTTAAGGNVYVGPSLSSSLLKFVSALARAQR
jgi:hypothetical protein